MPTFIFAEFLYLVGLGLGLQGLYSATNCADNILGRFNHGIHAYTHIIVHAMEACNK